jgi:hypothetical protein
MKAIIWSQPSTTSEVLRIELLREETVFHLDNGLELRVGQAPQKLQAELNRIEEIPGINLSAPPSTQGDIFYAPFMSRSVYDIVWPIVGSHSKIQKAFRGHPKLQAVTRLGYDELRRMPLYAYVSGPFGLYLGHPFDFGSRVPDPTLPNAGKQYGCAFRDGDYLVTVTVNLETRAVTVTQ